MNKRTIFGLVMAFGFVFAAVAEPRSTFLNDTLAEQLADQMSATLKVKNDPEHLRRALKLDLVKYCYI